MTRAVIQYVIALILQGSVSSLTDLYTYCDSENVCADANSECWNDTCTCSLGYVDVEGLCIAELGYDCSSDRECAGQNAVCNLEVNDGRCVCSDGYVDSNGECMPGLYTYCDSENACADVDSECLNDACSCRPGYVDVKGVCNAELGYNCSNTWKCADKNAVCIWFCICSNEYVDSNGDELAGKCIPDCIGVLAGCRGTVSRADNYCHCICDPWSYGPLCEISFTPSEWPSGPYALPMTKYGCPEGNYKDKGWLQGYINMTFTSSIRDYTQCRPMNNYTTDDFDVSLYQLDMFSYILGPFDDYNLQMNFCFKVKGTNKPNAYWMNGDYSIFGADGGCPLGFTGRAVSLCLPPVLQWNADGQLPYYNLTAEIDGTRLGLLFCDMFHTDVTTNNVALGRFLLLKNKDIMCPSQTTEIWYPFSVYDEMFDQVQFCLQNVSQIGRGSKSIRLRSSRTVAITPAGSLVTTSEGYFHGWIVFDSGLSNPVSQIRFEGNIDELEDSALFKVDSGVRITVSNERWSFYNNGGQECIYTRGYQYRSSIVYICDSLITGRYIVFDGKINNWDSSLHSYPSWMPRYRDIDITAAYTCSNCDFCLDDCNDENINVKDEAFKKLLDDISINVIMSFLKETEYSICFDSLGMQDYHIHDYQLSASTSASSTLPNMARPQLNGWCAENTDLAPFYQIDLIKVTTVEGISLYNGEQTVRGKDDSNTFVTSVTLKGTRSFHITYGSSEDHMMLYKKQEFRVDLSRPYSERQTFPFLNYFLARYVRVYPNKAHPTEELCLKFELHGCKLNNIHSLECQEDSLKEFFMTSTAYVPHAGDIVYYNDVTLDVCIHTCLSNHSECIAIQYSSSIGRCKTYISDSMKRYTRIRVSTEFDILGTVNCPLDAIAVVDPYGVQGASLNIFFGPVHITSTELVTSTGYPFEYQDIYFEGISGIEELRYTSIVFTDISLKQQTNKFDYFSGDTCIDGIYFNCELDIVSARTIDSSHNGLRLAFIPNHVACIRFKTCHGVESTGLDIARGFRAYVVLIETALCNINTTTMSGNCIKPTMKLQSFTFMGHPINENMQYIWRIQLTVSHVAINFFFEYFDISCQLDAKLSITDVHGVRFDYCNSNRPVGVQHFCPPFLEVTLQTSLILQNMFVEGMAARYSVVSHEEAAQFVDNTDEYVCPASSNKCYRVYINDDPISWASASELCTSVSSTMVTIKNIEELLFIKALLIMDWYHRRIRVEYPYVHIGLSRYIDQQEVLQETWADGTPLIFIAWAINEPSKVRQQRCTRMEFLNYYSTYVWSSEPCHTTDIKKGASYYICEISNHRANMSKNDITLHADHTWKDDHTLTGSETLFHCTSGEFTLVLNVCDGIANCLDTSDEVNCETGGESCGEHQFKCGSAECIQISGLCDFINDCNDASDEYCDHPSCSDYSDFQCQNGECIQHFKRCDSMPDCRDESDELTCDSCNTTLAFHCDDVKCISVRLVCDNVIDCQDGSDETSCEMLYYKTCDDVLRSGIRETGVFKMITNQYMECNFDNLVNGTVIMKYWNIDWQVLQEDKEYMFNSDQFFGFALSDHYNCLQDFAPTLRPVDAMIATLDKINYTGYDEPAVFTINSTSSEFGYPVTNHSYLDISKTSRTEYNIRVFIHTTFDTDKFRIPVGPVVCSKVVEYVPDQVFSCGNNLQPVPTTEVCVFELDHDRKVKGCRNMKHLQNCNDVTCRDGYVKCPDSFCIPAAYVCNERIDCPNGQDEMNCWCTDEPSTLIVATYDTSQQHQEHAFAIASRFVGPLRAVFVINIMLLQHLELAFAVHKLSKPNERVSEVFSYSNYDLSKVTRLVSDELAGEKLGFISVHITENFLNTELDICDGLQTKLRDGALNPYHLYIDSELSMPVEARAISIGVQDKYMNLTEIRVQKRSVLSTIGPLLFSDLCEGQSISGCINGHMCSGSRVCISLTQVCDDHVDCPFGDDERLCGFRCPTNCSCVGLSLICTTSKFSSHYMNIFSDKIRSLVIKTTSVLSDNPFVIGKLFPYLSVVGVSNTGITAVSGDMLTNIPNVMSLDLRYNNIQIIQSGTFDNLRHLVKLRLEGNYFLTYIEPGTFTGLLISELSLKWCSLVSLEKHTFKGLNLQVLDISFNKILDINDLAFDGLEVEHIDISNNPVNIFGKDIFKGVTSVVSLKTPAYKFCCIRPAYLNEANCEPRQDEFSSCQDLMRNSALQALMWIIGIFALIGNMSSIVYRLIFDRKRLKIGYGIFVTNLALADLLMGVYMLIIAVADTLFRNRYILMDAYWRSSWWCQFSGVISTISSEASVLFISLITMDRILVIKYPFGQIRFTSKSAIIYSVICWLITIVLAIFPILNTSYFENRFYTSRAVCIALPLTRDRPPGWLYSVLIFVGFNFIAFVLIAIGQCFIYGEIRKSDKLRKNMNVSRKKDLTVARNLLLVVSTDFMCWFPIGCMGVMSMLDVSIPSDVYAWTVVLILPINSALNPFMYTYSILIARRNLNPSVDEQEHTDITKEFSRTLANVLSRSQWFGKRERPLCTIKKANIVRKLTSSEVGHIAMELVKYLNLLHDNDLVTVDMTESDILTEVDEYDQMKIGEIQFLGTPRVVCKDEEKAADMYKVGLFINRLLKS